MTITTPARATSQTVVGVNTDAAHQRLLSQGSQEDTTGQTSSLLPEAGQLNVAATIKKSGAASGSPGVEAEPKRLRQAIPTADFVRNGGFKTGTKLLIKVVPSPAKAGDEIPQLVCDVFSLTSVTESDAERFQVHETFQDEVVFLFGRRPRIWTLQGVMVNGRTPRQKEGEADDEYRQRCLKKDMDFANKFIADYEEFYRGTKAIELGAHTYIMYDDTVIEGVILGLDVNRNSQMPSIINASVTFVVHNRVCLGTEASVMSPSLTQFLTKANELASEKVDPDTITPAYSGSAELASQLKAAEAAKLAATARAQAAGLEASALANVANDSENEIVDYEAEKTRAAEDASKALDDKAHAISIGDDEARDRAQENYEAAETRFADAAMAQEASRARGQEAESVLPSSQAALAQALADENSATAKVEVLTSTMAQSQSVDTWAMRELTWDQENQMTQAPDIIFEEGMKLVRYTIRRQNTTETGEMIL